jgi:dihydroxyacetone kinase-like protein
MNNEQPVCSSAEVAESMAVPVSEFKRRIRAAAQRLADNSEELSRLDAVCGDGDHGVGMRKVSSILEAVCAEGAAPLSSLIGVAAERVTRTVGGSSGVLWGAFLTGMAEGIAKVNSDESVDLTSAFTCGLDALMEVTPARCGDKTMMDALLPATAVLASSSGAIQERIFAASDAAHQGAESTSRYSARYGRAKNLGARSVGTPDPGAVSVALFFAGFADPACVGPEKSER